MSTMIVLSVLVDDKGNAVSYVAVNPFNNEAIQGRSAVGSNLNEGRRVNQIHRAVLEFAERWEKTE